MKPAIWESIKEGFRLALFGALAYGVTYVTQYFNAMPQTDQTIIVVTFIFRLIDKWLYESGVAKKGISRF